MTTAKKEYVIESKGWDYASKSLQRKKDALNEMIKEIAKESNMTIEEVKIKFNIK